MKFTGSVAEALGIALACGLFVGAFFELYQGFVAIRDWAQ